MKQCPTCNHTYSDDTLSYCLEDGSLLRTVSDPQATQRIPAPPATQSFTPLHSQAPQSVKRRWPIFAAVAVLLLMVGGGAIAVVLLAYSRSAATSSVDVRSSNDSSPKRAKDTKPGWTEPSPSPTIESRQMVGVWRTTVYEDNQTTEITYTFTPDGRSTMRFRYGDGTTASDSGTWQYSDGILFERFSNGASGKGAIRWIDDDHFEITIIDNGVPAYSGLKRVYRRVP